MTYVVEDTDKPESTKWYKLWWNVWSHPGINSFRSMRSEPNDTAGRGFTWIGCTGITIFAVYLIWILRGGDFANLPTDIFGSSMIIMFAAAIIGVVAIIFWLIVSAGFCHLIAKAVGSKDSYSRLIFCFAAIQAPWLIFMAFFFFSARLWIAPEPNLIIAIVCCLLISVYGLVLTAFAIEAVENIGKAKSFIIVGGSALIILARFFVFR